MTTSTPLSLASPLTLPGGATLPNRLAKSAMSERLGLPDGRVSAELVTLYERWATGGAGLLITGNVMVDGRSLGETGNVVIEDARDLPALRTWARVAKSGGSQVWMQLNHPGRQSPRTLTRDLVAPSAVGVRGAGPLFAVPRALTGDEITAILGRFATTARVAERAGFDGVQLHGAHGYLVSQFLSPLTNRRDDAWGGDAVRRRRFLIELVRAVRAAVGRGFAVGLKLNSADFQKGGFEEAESMELLEVLDGEGLDLIEISGGTHESTKMFEETIPTRASTRRREAFFLDYVEKARARVQSPLMLTGGFRTLRGMEEARGSGAVDVIGLGRPLALEPALAAALLSGEREAALPVQLATGIATLDAVIQGSWYQAQLDRMGHGLAPDPGLGRWWPVLRYLAGRRMTALPVASGVPAVAG